MYDVIAVPFRKALRGESDANPILHPGDIVRTTRRFDQLVVSGLTLERLSRGLRPTDLMPITLNDEIGPGDYLTLRWQQTDALPADVQEFNVAVDEAGQIKLPNEIFPPVAEVVGLSPSVAARRVAQACTDRGQSVNIRIQVRQSRQNLVTILPAAEESTGPLPTYFIPDGNYRFSQLMAKMGPLPPNTTGVYIFRPVSRND